MKKLTTTQGNTMDGSVCSEKANFFYTIIIYLFIALRYTAYTAYR